MMDVDGSMLKTDQDSLRRTLSGAGPTIHSVEYGTFDELWCQAHFFWARTAEFANETEAFIFLWRAYLERTEEFPVGDNQMELFIRSLEDNGGYGKTTLFVPLEKEAWQRETALVTGGIRRAIADVRSGKRLVRGERIELSEGRLDLADPNTYWGIFVDGQRVLDDRPHEDFVPGDFVDGSAIRADWNNMQFFQRTTEAYVLFAWSTGA